MKRTRAFLVVGVLLAVLLAAGSATPASAKSLRARMFDILNRVREHHGLHDFRLNLDLSASARHHSRHMANEDRVFHTANLTTKLRGTHWSICGENVAEAGTLHRVRELWMHSAGHRANMLDRRFDHVGVGVVHARGRMWVTVMFYG